MCGLWDDDSERDRDEAEANEREERDREEAEEREEQDREEEKEKEEQDKDVEYYITGDNRALPTWEKAIDAQRSIAEQKGDNACQTMKTSLDR